MDIILSIGAFFNNAIGPLARKALAALGLGVISYTAVSSAINSLIDTAKGYFDGLPGFVLSIMSLAGLGQAMAMITGALLVRAALASTSKIGLLTGGNT
jgi:hypothetical protein